MKKSYEAPTLRKAGMLSAVTAQQGSSNFKEEPGVRVDRPRKAVPRGRAAPKRHIPNTRMPSRSPVSAG